MFFSPSKPCGNGWTGDRLASLPVVPGAFSLKGMYRAEKPRRWDPNPPFCAVQASTVKQCSTLMRRSTGGMGDLTVNCATVLLVVFWRHAAAGMMVEKAAGSGQAYFCLHSNRNVVVPRHRMCGSPCAGWVAIWKTHHGVVHPAGSGPRRQPPPDGATAQPLRGC